MKATLGLLALTLAAAAPLAPVPDADWQNLAVYEDHEPLHPEGFAAASSFDQNAKFLPAHAEEAETSRLVSSADKNRESWRPTGRLGALLNALGVSPEIEWSHRPSTPPSPSQSKARTVVAVPAEGDLLRLGGRWYAVSSASRSGLSPFGFRGKPTTPLPKEEGGYDVYTLTTMGPSRLQRAWNALGSGISETSAYLTQTGRDAYHALQDRRVYAAAMLVVAFINFVSIIIVLAYFRREPQEEQLALVEEAHDETITPDEKV